MMDGIDPRAFNTTPAFDSLTVEDWISGPNGGPLTLLADPVGPLDAATKEYVDALAASSVPTSSPYPPANPINNQLWFSSSSGQLYIWYQDPNSSQWVIANNTGVQDAPMGSTAYGRQNGTWQPVLPLGGGAMTGPLILAQDPTTYFMAATKGYVDISLNRYLPLGGGTLSGPLILSTNPTVALGAATKNYVDTHSGITPVSNAPPLNPISGQLWFDSVTVQTYIWSNDAGGVWVSANNVQLLQNGASGIYTFPPNPLPGTIAQGPNGMYWVWDGVKWVGGTNGPYLPLSGGIMAGPIILPGNPTTAREAATKQYVDSVASQIKPAPMDGQSYGMMLNDWNPVLPMTGGTMRGAINMAGWVLTGLRTPSVDTDAVDKAYVDAIASNIVVYQGTWQVAANIPDISNTSSLAPGSYYLAVTADPATPETAPANIPGIGGTSISNGSMIIWNADLGVYQALQSGQLTVAEADLLYLQLTGGVMTGDLILNGDPTQPLQAATKQYVDDSGGAGGIPEAPTDGQVYGRDGATLTWVPVLTTTAAVDGGTF